MLNTIFQLYIWWGQVTFQRDDDDDVNKVSWIFIVILHWPNSPWVDISLHSDTLCWFRANLPSLLLLNAGCLEEKLILLSFVYPDRDLNPRSTALEVSMLAITLHNWPPDLLTVDYWYHGSSSHFLPDLLTVDYRYHGSSSHFFLF